MVSENYQFMKASLKLTLGIDTNKNSAFLQIICTSTSFLAKRKLLRQVPEMIMDVSSFIGLHTTADELLPEQP